LDDPIWVDMDGRVEGIGVAPRSYEMVRVSPDGTQLLLTSGRDGADVVMLTLGTGVGSGVVINGELLRGHYENAAELGHMVVALDGLPCPCGQKGCLEQYASAGAVVRRVSAALAAGEESDIRGHIAPIDAKLVEYHARRGDALCSRIWNEACVFLALACINIQHAFNPARIVLGGGMALAGEFLLNRVRAEVRRRAWNLIDDVPQIVLADLGADAGVIGAAGLAWKLLKEPE
jgi:glucokinase